MEHCRKTLMQMGLWLYQIFLNSILSVNILILFFEQMHMKDSLKLFISSKIGTSSFCMNLFFV